MPSHKDDDDDYDLNVSIRDLGHASTFVRQRSSSHSLMSTVQSLGSHKSQTTSSNSLSPKDSRRSSLSQQQQSTQLMMLQEPDLRPRSRSFDSDRSLGSSRFRHVGSRSRRNSCPELATNAGFSDNGSDDPTGMVGNRVLRMSHISEQGSDEAEVSVGNNDESHSSSWENIIRPSSSASSTRRSPTPRGRFETMASTRSSDMSPMSLMHSSDEEEITFFNDDTSPAALDYDEDDDDYYDDARRHSLSLRVCGCLVVCRCISHPTPMCLAEAVVTYAPCFILSGRDFKQHTARAILWRLNALLVFFTLYQMAAGMFLLIVLFSPNVVDRNLSPQGDLSGVPPINTDSPPKSIFLTITWNVIGVAVLALVVGFFVFISAVFAWRVIRFVNLVGAVRYFWALSWFTPFQTFCVFGLMDYHNVTAVWVKLWWRDHQLAWFRMKSCAAGTYNTLCTVPQYPDSASQDDWCLMNYNATNCTAIRDDAQAQTSNGLKTFYYVGASWGLLLLFLILLVMDALEDIVTKPLIQKSRQSHITLWLSLPFVTCLVIGVLLNLAARNPFGLYVLGDFRFMGYVPLITAGLLFTAGVLGVYINNATIKKSSDKRRQMAAVGLFIGAMFSASALLLASFAVSVAYSIYFGTNSISHSVRGTVACFFDNDSICTGCNSTVPEDQCSQWSYEDVVAVIRTHCKSVATLSLIFMLYCFSLLRFGFNMRRHLMTYQIEYV